MPDFARPTIFLSKCFAGAACRWNGEVSESAVAARLLPFVNVIEVCPEMEIGLGVPRPPVRVVEWRGQRRLWQPETNRDLTESMRACAADALAHLPPVDGFLFKARSPSCGLTDVKLYRGKKSQNPIGKTAGLFAGEAVARFPLLPAEDEDRLTSFAVRERFLTRLFTLADFRRARRLRTARALVDFQARHKLLLMACRQTTAKQLGAIVANATRRLLDETTANYQTMLLATLAQAIKPGPTINVLEHAFGYFKKALTAQEKRGFLALLDRFRARRIPLAAVNAVLVSWIDRDDVAYLQQQSFFAPYPPALAEFGPAA
jgi:uncharacterized protein YbgA (DUF1722 family)/uncharacterized protein YbbK (DUF523 family)